MPTIYTWSVDAGSSGGPVAPVGPGVGTGVGDGRAYAVSRRLDPTTRDVVFDPLRSTWATGAPVTERVLRCLHTERGTAARDPSYGVDWSAVDNARANVGAIAAQVVRTALQRFEKRGDIVGLVVEVVTERAEAGAALFLRVQYADTRGARTTIVGAPQ